MAMQFEGVFEVDQVKPRKLRNGNRMQVVLEAPYDEESFAELSHFNFMNVIVFMKEDDEGQKDLFDEGEGSGGKVEE